ncbi:MAG: rhodanese-like domain-containing protein [Rhodocyclaceae bacterium]|nr:rhodanese-like domain-containing protein [Rhodocyclaceae bacterium]
MKQITALQLKQWLDDAKAGKREAPLLIDVREPWEYHIVHIPGAKLMPMRTIPLRIHELPREKDLAIVCHHGARSYQVCLFLEQHGFDRLFNLYGGMAAWSRDADPTAPTY